MKKSYGRKGKRWFALYMCLCLIGTTTPVAARAENGKTGDILYVSGFVELSEEVREQTVSVGMDLKDLTLPAELTVSLAEDENITETEQESGTEPENGTESETETETESGTEPENKTEIETELTDSAETDESGEADEPEKSDTADEDTDVKETDAAEQTANSDNNNNNDDEDSDNDETGQKTYTVTMPEYNAENVIIVETLETDTTQEAPATITGITWQSEPEYDQNIEGKYIFTAVLPEGYALAEGVSLPQITVTVQEESTDDVVQALIDRIAALPDSEEYLAGEPDTGEEEAYEKWMEGLYGYAEEALAILEEYEALTKEQQEKIPEEMSAKLTAWTELAKLLAPGMVLAADSVLPENCGFTVTGGAYGTDYQYEDNTLKILTDTAITISGKGSATTDTIFVNSGVNANITLQNVNIDVSSNSAAAFKIADNSAGNVTVTLSGVNTLKSGYHCAGLQKNGSTSVGTLTIKGDGSLTASGDRDGAGIGGGQYGAGSNIIISGGTVTASGGYRGAGIGGGYNGAGSDITISGGTVTASGGQRGAGIGGGYNKAGSDITISGGTVTATGGTDGAGIGGGYYGAGSNITISGSNTVVCATGGGAENIGSGVNKTSTSASANRDGGLIIEGSTGKIYSDVELKSDFTIDSTVTLNIDGDDSKNSTLTVAENVTLTNNGTININSGDKLIVNGTLVNNGTIKNSGSISGSGSITGNPVVISGVAINEVNFPDDIFRQYVLEACDIDQDGFLSDEEIGQVTKIIVTNSGIQSLGGIEYFASLKNLECASNRLTSIDVSRNTALSVLDCRKNNLTSLDTSSNTALSELICSYNNLTSLDLSRNTALSELYCYNNNLTSLDISNNTLLKYLDCDFNQLTSLDVSKNTALKILCCDSNQLTSLDVGNNTALTDLRCDGNRYNIGETCGAYDLKDLPVGFDLTKASNWRGATLESDVLTGIADNGFISYDYDCGNNHTATVYLTYDLVDHTYDDGVITIEPTEQTEGEKTYTCINCGTIKTEPIAKVELADGVEINEVNFPDDIFRQYVLDNFDQNSNGLLSDDEISAVKKIDVKYKNIQSLKGVEYFTELTNLDCSGNHLTSLDVSQNTALTTFYCYNNQLTSLDVSKNTMLILLQCDGNQLTSLNVSKNTALTTLWCYRNQLTSLDVGNNTALTDLRCNDNLYYIGETCGAYDLKNLPVGFDLTKASSWQGATLESDVLTGIADNGFISYDYDCGNNHTATVYLTYDLVDHTYDDGVITIEPTELTEGEKTYTCTKCGAIKTEPIAKLGHVHNQGTELMSDATGHWYTCSGCDEKLDFATHTEDSGTVTVEPTINTEGQKVYKCTVCGYTTRTETIAKHTHSTAETVSEKAATCTEDGNTAYYICSCGKWFSDTACTNEITDHAGVIVEKLGHSFSGQYLFDENGHWKVCSRCNVPQTPESHVFDDNNDTTCNKCDYQRTIGTHTHSVARTVDAKEAACTTAGNSAYYICTCGKWFSDSACTREVTEQDVTIAAKGHDFSGSYQRDAKEHWKICSRCGVKDTAHKHRYDNGRDAYCNDCNYKRTISSSGTDNGDNPDESSNPNEPSNTDNPNNPNTVIYKITDGANISWTLGSSENITFRGNGVFSKFTGVKVDGVLLDKSSYDAKEGSTIITLKAAYLNTLRIGTHTIEILWTDGSAVSMFTVNAKSSDNNSSMLNNNDAGQKNHEKDNEPKTGDNTPLELYATLAMIAGFTYLLFYFTDRRHGMTEETKKELVARIVRWAKQGGGIRKCLAFAVIFVLLVYYHSIGKKTCAEWKEIYGE